MQKAKDNRKVAFSVLGEVVLSENKKRIQIKSPDHYQQQVAKLVAGSRVALTVEEYQPTKSQAQHNYYWALIGYLADYSGHEPTELHDAIMRQKFGTKQIVIGEVKQQVRRSIANIAKFPKAEMVELIEEVLDICRKQDVHVPTKEQLGYI